MTTACRIPAMCRVRRVLALVAALGLAASLALAQKPAEVHGSLDAYAGDGIAMAWGIVRGKDEATTTVVVRVEADAARYGSVSVTGVDPIAKTSQVLMPAMPINRMLTFRAPRARFADLPRTEWRFYAPGAGGDAAPALLVWYQGIPDTTPEVADEARLEADLARRLERARSAATTK